jgi:hypothetical protein
MGRFATPYELNEIYGVITDRGEPTPTELQSNFGRVKPFETETINLDAVAPDLRIGAFVAPDVSAKPTTLRGFSTKVFYPSYWKDKSTVDFRNIRARRLGEQISVPTSNAGKIAQALQDSMSIALAKRERLLEWIAAQIMLYGSYVSTSDRHPSVLIDLEPNIATHATTGATPGTTGVPTAQAVALNSGRANRANISGTDVTLPTGATLPTLGTNRTWNKTNIDAGNATPIADLQSMLDAAYEPISKIYISENAWQALLLDPLFAKTIQTTIVVATTPFIAELLPKQESKEGLKLRGMMGAIPLWTYNAGYQPLASASTVTTKFLPDGWVVMVPQASYGIQAYGAIQHGLADFAASELFFNSWTEDEFGTPWLQAQSAPAFLHTKVNSTCAWKVC